MARVYVPVSADFFGNDQIIEISPLARLVYIAMLCISKRQESDGIVSLGQVRREVPDVENLVDLISELNDIELVIQIDENKYQIVAWLKWNKSSDELDKMRADKAVAGRIGGKRSGQVRAEASASLKRRRVLDENEAPSEPNTTKDNSSKDTPSELNSSSSIDGEDEVLMILAKRRLASRKIGLEPISDKAKWIDTVATGLRKEYGDRLKSMPAEKSPDQKADWLESIGQSSRLPRNDAQYHLENSLHGARLAGDEDEIVNFEAQIAQLEARHDTRLATTGSARTRRGSRRRHHPVDA